MTFTARAAGELRTRLRALGAGGVQARTFHAAALRQLSYFAPQILGGPMPDVASNPIRWVSQAANRLRLRTDKAELRDLAGEIDWAKSSLVSPEDYPVAAAKANRGISLTAARVAEVYAGYEEAKRRNNEIDFSDLLLIMAGALEEIPRGRSEPSAPSTATSSSTSTRTSRRSSSGCSTPGSASGEDLCVVGDANQTIYSFAGARAVLPARLRRPLPGGAGDPAGARLPLHPADRRPGQPPDRRASAGSARAPATDRPAPGRPAPTFAEHDDEVAEAESVAAAGQAADRRRARRRRRSRCCSGSTPSPRSTSRRSPRLGIPYVLRGGEKFFERAEVRQAMVLLRGAARADDGSVSLPEAVAEVLSSLGWNAEHPPPGGAARERWESLAALVSLAEQFPPRYPTARLDELNAATWSSGPPPSTPRRCRA